MTEPQRDIFDARRKLLEGSQRDRLIEAQAKSQDYAARAKLQQQIDYLEPRGFGDGYFKTAEGTERTVADFLPFANAAAQSARLERLEGALDRISRNEGQEGDQDVVRAFWDEQVRPASWTYTAGRIAADAVPFALEFMATKKVTGGMLAAGSKLASLTGRAGKVMRAMSTPYQQYARYTKAQALKRPIMGGIQYAAAVEAPRQLVGQTIIGETIGGSRLRASMYNNYIANRYSLDVKGDLGLSVRVADDSYGMFSSALPAALFDNYVEMFSESIGDALVHLPAAMKLASLDKTTKGAKNPILSFLGIDPDPKHIALWSDFGFQGLVPELGEELVGALIRDVTHQVLPELAEGGNTEHFFENLPAIALGMAAGMFAPAALHSGINMTDVVLARANWTPTDAKALEKLRKHFEDDSVVSKVGRALVDQLLIAQRHTAQGGAQVAVNETVRGHFLQSDTVKAEARQRVEERAARKGQPVTATQEDIELEMQTMLDELHQLPMESEDGTHSPLLERLAELELLDPEQRQMILETYKRRLELLRQAVDEGALQALIDEFGDDAARAALATAQARGIDVSNVEWAGAAHARRAELKAKLKKLFAAEETDWGKVNQVLTELALEEAQRPSAIEAAQRAWTQASDTNKAYVGAYLELLDDLSAEEGVPLQPDSAATFGGVLGQWARNLGVVLLRVREANPTQRLRWGGRFVDGKGLIWINMSAVDRMVRGLGISEEAAVRRYVLHEMLHSVVRKLPTEQRIAYLQDLRAWLNEAGIPAWDKATEDWYRELHSQRGSSSDLLLEEEVVHRLDVWSGLVETGLPLQEEQRKGWRRLFGWVVDSLMTMLLPRTRFFKQMTRLRGEIESYAESQGIKLDELSDRQVLMMVFTIDHIRELLSMQPEKVEAIYGDFRSIERALTRAEKAGVGRTPRQRTRRQELGLPPDVAGVVGPDGELEMVPSDEEARAREDEMAAQEAAAQEAVDELRQREAAEPTPEEVAAEPEEDLDAVDDEKEAPTNRGINQMRKAELEQLLEELFPGAGPFVGAEGTERAGKPARVVAMRKALKHRLGIKTLEGRELQEVSDEIGYDLSVVGREEEQVAPVVVKPEDAPVAQEPRPRPVDRTVTRAPDDEAREQREPQPVQKPEAKPKEQPAKEKLPETVEELQALLEEAQQEYEEVLAALPPTSPKAEVRQAKLKLQARQRLTRIEMALAAAMRKEGDEAAEVPRYLSSEERNEASLLAHWWLDHRADPRHWYLPPMPNRFYDLMEIRAPLSEQQIAEARRIATELYRVQRVALIARVLDAYKAAGEQVTPALIDHLRRSNNRSLENALIYDDPKRIVNSFTMSRTVEAFARSQKEIAELDDPSMYPGDLLLSLDPWSEVLGERELEDDDKRVVRRVQPIFYDGPTNEPLQGFDSGLRMYDGALTPAEIANIERVVQMVVDPRGDYRERLRGTTLNENKTPNNRRLQMSFGAKYEYGSFGRKDGPKKGVYDDRIPVEPLPRFMESIIDTLIASGVLLESERPNSALINIYPRGAATIPPHNDLEGDQTAHHFTAPVTTIRFGSNAVMTFGYGKGDQANSTRQTAAYRGQQRHAVILPRGSVAVMRGPAATEYTHSIMREDTTEGDSFSITFRRVEWDKNDYQPTPDNTPSIFDEAEDALRYRVLAQVDAKTYSGGYQDWTSQVDATGLEPVKHDGSGEYADLEDVTIVSGGQLGVDTYAMEAAYGLGLATMGSVPQGGYRGKDVDDISSEEMEMYGYVPQKQRGFARRTITNAQIADGTVWFGRADSPGSWATLDVRTQAGKPQPIINPTPAELATWMHLNGVRTLNVAGNRPELLEGTGIDAAYIAQHLADTMRFLQFLRSRPAPKPGTRTEPEGEGFVPVVVDPQFLLSELEESRQKILRARTVKGAIMLGAEYAYQVVRYDKDKYELPFNEMHEANIVQLEAGEARPFRPSKSRAREEWGRKPALQEEDYADEENSNYGWVVPGQGKSRGSVVPISRQQPLIPRILGRRLQSSEEARDRAIKGELRVMVAGPVNRTARKAGIFEDGTMRPGRALDNPFENDLVRVEFEAAPAAAASSLVAPQTYIQEVSSWELYDSEQYVYTEAPDMGLWSTDGVWIEGSGSPIVKLRIGGRTREIDVSQVAQADVSRYVENAMRRFAADTFEAMTPIVAGRRRDVLFEERGRWDWFDQPEEETAARDVKELSADEQKQAAHAYFWPALASYLGVEDAVARSLFVATRTGVRLNDQAVKRAYRGARRVGGERVSDFEQKQFEALVEEQVQQLVAPISAALGRVYSEGTTLALQEAVAEANAVLASEPQGVPTARSVRARSVLHLATAFGVALNEVRETASERAGAAVLPMQANSEQLAIVLETVGSQLDTSHLTDEADIEAARRYTRAQARAYYHKVLREQYAELGAEIIAESPVGMPGTYTREAPQEAVEASGLSRSEYRAEFARLAHKKALAAVREAYYAQGEMAEYNPFASHKSGALTPTTEESITDREWRAILGRMYVNSLGLLQLPSGAEKTQQSSAQADGTLSSFGRLAWWERYHVMSVGGLQSYEVGQDFSMLQSLGIISAYDPRAISDQDLAEQVRLPEGQRPQRSSALTRMVGLVGRVSSGPVVFRGMADSLQTSMPFPIMSSASSEALLQEVLPAQGPEVMYAGLDVVAVGMALANDDFSGVHKALRQSDLPIAIKTRGLKEFQEWRTSLEKTLAAASQGEAQRYSREMIARRRRAWMQLRKGDLFGDLRWQSALAVAMAVQAAQIARANIHGDISVLHRASRLVAAIENEEATQHPIGRETYDAALRQLQRELLVVDQFLEELRLGNVESARQMLRQHHETRPVLMFNARTETVVSNPSFLLEDATKAARAGTDVVVFKRENASVNLVLDPFAVYDPYRMTPQQMGDKGLYMERAIGRVRMQAIEALKLASAVRHHAIQEVVDQHVTAAWAPERSVGLEVLEEELAKMVGDDPTGSRRALMAGVLKAVEMELQRPVEARNVYAATFKAVQDHLANEADIDVENGVVIVRSRRAKREVRIATERASLPTMHDMAVPTVLHRVSATGTFEQGAFWELMRPALLAMKVAYRGTRIEMPELQQIAVLVEDSPALAGDSQWKAIKRAMQESGKPTYKGAVVYTAEEITKAARAVPERGLEIFAVDPFALDGGDGVLGDSTSSAITPATFDGNGFLGLNMPTEWDPNNMPKGFEGDWTANWFVLAYDDWVRTLNRKAYEANLAMGLFRDTLEKFVDDEGVKGFAKFKRMQDINEAMTYAINIKGWLTEGGRRKARALGIKKPATTFDEYVALAKAEAEKMIEGERNVSFASPRQKQRMEELLVIAKQIFEGEGRWAALGFNEYNDSLGFAGDMVLQAQMTTDAAKKARLTEGVQEVYIQTAWVFPEEEGAFEADQYGVQEIGAPGGPVRQSVGARRLSRSFYGIVHGASLGLRLQRPGAIEAWHNTTKYVAESIYNRNFIEAMKTVGIVTDMRGRGGVRKGYKALKVKGLRGYQAPEWVAKYLNSAMTQYGVRDIENGFYKGYMRLNIAAKHMMLMFGFFHHQAFMRSYLFTVRKGDMWGAGGWQGALKMLPAWAMSYGRAFGLVSQERLERVASRFTPYAIGRQTADEMSPDLMLGIEEGLTIQRGNEVIGNPAGALYDIEDDAEFDQWIRKLLGKLEKAGLNEDRQQMVFDWVQNFRTAQRETAQWLFNSMGANLKVAAYMSEFNELLIKHHDDVKKDPEGARRRIAKMAADKINGDFGGLNLRARGGKVSDLFKQGGPRDPRVQMALRAMILAPDWTESNLYTVLGAMMREDISGSTEAMQRAKMNMFRHMWLRVGSRALAVQFMINMLLAGIDPDRDMYDLYQEAGFYGPKDKDDKQTPSWLKFRWLDINASMFSPTDSKKFISVFGHFGDPLKWTADIIKDGPLAPIDRKGSVAMRAIVEAITGSDYSGRRFTTLREILGADYDAGEYQRITTLADGTIKYPGESKAGKYAGKLSRFSVKTGPVELEQVLGGGYLWTQIFKFTPLQVRGIAEYIMGQKDGFDLVMEVTGTKYGKTYVQ